MRFICSTHRGTIDAGGEGQRIGSIEGSYLLRSLSSRQRWKGASGPVRREVLKRTRRGASKWASTRRAGRDESFIRWILSRPVPRQLLIDILREDAAYRRTSQVADAHAAHIRALRQRGRRSEQNSQSTYPSSQRVPTVVAIDAEEFAWSDPWSRRVPTVVGVDADEFQSLLEQVQDLHRLSDEITRSRERVDAKARTRAD